MNDDDGLRGCWYGRRHDEDTARVPHARPQIVGLYTIPGKADRSWVVMWLRFEGTVKEILAGFALVEYDELMQESNSSERLLEWFSVPGTQLQDPGRLPSGAPCNLSPGYVLRPAPPTQVGRPH